MVRRDPAPAMDDIAEAIHRRGLAAPALFLLDAHRAYRPLAAHAMTFLAPLVGSLAPARRLVEGVVDSDDAVDRLIVRLESLERGEPPDEGRDA